MALAAEPFRQSSTPGTAALREAAADALIESYVEWREASLNLQTAYEGWEAAHRSRRETAFGGYLAALQHEQHAARVYQRRIERVRLLAPFP